VPEIRDDNRNTCNITETCEYDVLMEQGFELFETAEWKKAQTHFEDLIQRFSSEPRPYTALGIVYRELDLDEESERTLRKAIDMDPEDSFTWRQFGFTLYALWRFREAEEAFRRCLKLDSEDVWALIGLADVLKDNDQLDDARDLLLRATRLEPDNFWVWLDLGKVYRELGKMEQATDAFLQALERDEENPAPLRQLGEVYMEVGDFGKARHHFGLALEISPEYYHVKRDLAKIHVRLGEVEEAESLLKELLKQDEDDCEVWSLLGQVYLRTKRLGLAEKAFNEALAECSNLVSAHQGLLTVYEKTDRVEEAEDKRERLRGLVEGVVVTQEVLDSIINEIDPSIQDIIAELHSLGLMTSSCCSGLPEDHPDREPQKPYVYFCADYDGAHHHLITIANMAGWIGEYGVNGWGVEVFYGSDEPEEIREAWSRLIQMAWLVMPKLRIYIDVVLECEWKKEEK
jgi:tetratricopeptide (TPR) repeat protein